MRDPFLLVVIGVSVLAFVGAVIALATSGGSYDRIGRGGLSIGDDLPAPARAPARQVSVAERDTEIRQLLEARNAPRRARSGSAGRRGRGLETTPRGVDCRAWPASAA